MKDVLQNPAYQEAYKNAFSVSPKTGIQVPVSNAKSILWWVTGIAVVAGVVYVWDRNRKNQENN